MKKGILDKNLKLFTVDSDTIELANYVETNQQEVEMSIFLVDLSNSFYCWSRWRGKSEEEVREEEVR